MKHLLIAAAASLCCALASAASPVRAEIEALLLRLQGSGCQFNRNGSWHSAAEARSHLLRKLDYLEGRGTLQSTEQFIELAAARSSLSGKPYQVQCENQAPVTSQDWLTQQLAIIRR